MKTASANDSKIRLQARDWFVAMQADAVTPEQQRALKAWLQRDLAHRQAYDRYSALWDDLGRLGQSDEGARLRQSSAPGPEWQARLGRLLAVLTVYVRPHPAFAAGAVLLVLAALWLYPSPPAVEHYQSARGELQQIRLGDGSHVVLGAQSSLRFFSDDSGRYAELLAGQISISVVKNPQRPFVVNAGNTQITVIGTHFDVNKGREQVSVSVLEGVVRVTQRADDNSDRTVNTDRAASAQLRAGQQVIHRQGLMSPVNEVDVADISAWQRGKLVYRAVPLREVVADANRYYPGVIVISDADLAAIEVSASLDIARIAELPELLSELLPLRVIKDEQHNVVLLPRIE